MKGTGEMIGMIIQDCHTNLGSSQFITRVLCLTQCRSKCTLSNTRVILRQSTFIILRPQY